MQTLWQTIKDVAGSMQMLWQTIGPYRGHNSPAVLASLDRGREVVTMKAAQCLPLTAFTELCSVVLHRVRGQMFKVLNRELG